jgi:hypothetical protein
VTAPGRRWVGGDDLPGVHPDVAARWRDEDRWAARAAAADAARAARPDVEWSSEQTFAGEFGTIDQFGETRD